MKQVKQFVKQYQLLTDWFISVLDGVSDMDGSKTVNDHINSLEWLAGHLITGRYRNMMRLGIQVEPYKYLAKFQDQSIPPPNAIAFDPKIKYSTLTECREQWILYSELFLDKLKSMDETMLGVEIPFTVLTGGNKLEDALAFIVMHESYHIGQMSNIRKSLGYHSMQLSRRKN